MIIHLIAIGNKMPDWVKIGYQEYARRLPPECTLKLIEIPAEPRLKSSSIPQILLKEGSRLLRAIPAKSQVIALTLQGKLWSTEDLAKQMDSWRTKEKSISLLVGGPEGLSPQCIEKANSQWSLGPLTFPHPLVRVIIAEQVYRAWSLLQQHPYHRN